MRTGTGKSRTATATLALTALVVVLVVSVAPAAGAATERKAAGATAEQAKKQRKQKRHRRAKPQRPAYWGAWIGTQLTGGQPPWDMSAANRFSELAAKAPSLLQFAAPFANCASSPCDFYEFPAYEMEAIRRFGAIPFFSWASQSLPVGDEPIQPAFQLSDLLAGDYDAYIREWATSAREWGHPFFLRFNWEMNSDWFPWSEQANGNRPGDHIRSWRHVHDIFTAVGATNATWVWCPYSHAKKRFGRLALYYPGDAYVDWTCLDGFNWGSNGVNPQRWRSFDAIFGRSYRTIVRKLAPGKPMVIAEVASGGRGRAKSIWVKRMFKDLRTKYRRVRALLWFEQIDRGVQWPIETAPRVIREFRRGIRQPAFKTNEFAGLTGAPIGPPR